MSRFYDPPFRFWCKDALGRLHTIKVLRWDLASDYYYIEDTCCNKQAEITASVLAKGTAAPWNAASTLEADEWLDARVSLGLANVYTY